MDSPPHQCSYSQYGCGHKVKNCHPDMPFNQRHSNPYRSGRCPKCEQRYQQSEVARFAPAVG